MSQEQNNDWDILDIASKTSKFIESNFKAFLGLFVVAIIGGAIWNVMQYQAQQEQKKAFAELFEITKVYDKKKEDFAAAKNKKDNPKKDKEPKDADDKGDKKEKELVAATGDLGKDYGEIVQQLEAFLDKNLGTNASGEAALVLSEIYAEYDEPKKGAEALSKALGKWNTKNVILEVMNMRAGDLWATADDCAKAADHWLKVSDTKTFFAHQADLKRGVCLQKLGRIDEARQAFQKIKEKVPNSSEGFSAKRYLRFLDFKTKSEQEKGDDKAQAPAKDQDKKS